jgi:PAS domain S-box-containing protein
VTILGLGQPAAAFPAAPRGGRAGLLALGGVTVAVVAVLGALLAVRVDPVLGGLTAVTSLVAFTAAQLVLVRRQRQLTGALHDSRAAFRILVKSSLDPVVILDERLRVTFVSEAITDLLGLDPACVLGRPIEAAVHPDDAPTLLGALNGPPSQHNELAVRTARVAHADGRWRLIQATVRDLRSDPEVGALVLYCRDVTRAPTAEVDPELLELSLTDPVTGLPNRAALVRRLGAVQKERLSHRFTLALIGVDGLADDLLTPGTEATVLRAVTSRLTRALRGEDWLARGKDGDFVVLVDGSISDAEIVAARLVAAVGPLRTAGGILRLTAARRHPPADRRRRRHHALGGRRHRRSPAPRRPRPPQRPGRRARIGPPLRRRPPPRAGPPRGPAHRPRRRPRPRRAAAGLPARRRRRHAPHRLGRGPAPLAAPPLR